ncbi:MAG: hypothetical protein D6675_04120 [Gemmatimonadetes bacterium]|nr:MAG: hypothetical protein D6675_04120 [Gemmatimonadota bacterium]
MQNFIERIEYARQNVVRTKTNLELAKLTDADGQIQEMSYYLALANYFGLASKYLRKLAELNRPLSDEERQIAEMLRFDKEHFQQSQDGRRLQDEF